MCCLELAAQSKVGRNSAWDESTLIPAYTQFISPIMWQYRDLDQTAQVAFTVWEVREGRPLRALAGTTLRLFSKKGRLKTGSQMLRLWLPGPADHAWPSQTPGKVPVSQRGEQGCAAVWWGQGGAV